jgi:hypothetical protein
MVKELRLTPINPPKIITTTNPPANLDTTTKREEIYESEPVFYINERSKEIEEVLQSLEVPINAAETFEINIPDPQIPHQVHLPPEQLETTRRSFESVSGPVRHSPIESRTGKVFRVDPEEVFKESKSLAVDFEGN